MPEEVQNPEFWIDPAGAPITVSARDGKRLAAALEHHASPEANSAAVKIRNNKKIANANPEPKGKPKTKPKKETKIVVPKFDVKASTVW